MVIETPYDEIIIQLQREMHGTVIPYGSGRRRADIAKRSIQLADSFDRAVEETLKAQIRR